MIRKRFYCVSKTLTFEQISSVIY